MNRSKSLACFMFRILPLPQLQLGSGALQRVYTRSLEVCQLPSATSYWAFPLLTLMVCLHHLIVNK